MPQYIPFAQVRQLREAAQSGDERARKILIAQMNDEDFSAELEDYFKPAEEEKIEEVAEQPQEQAKQDATQTMADKEMPALTGKPDDSEISNDILALISACDKKTLELANNTEISDATKKGALSILQEIKQSCLENLEKFGKLMSSISKKTVEEEL